MLRINFKIISSSVQVVLYLDAQLRTGSLITLTLPTVSTYAKNNNCLMSQIIISQFQVNFLASNQRPLRNEFAA